VCGQISGGDPASVSVILSEVADNLTPHDVNAILDGPTAPAAALAQQLIELGWVPPLPIPAELGETFDQSDTPDP
jgi:hypothetical protein